MHILSLHFYLFLLFLLAPLTSSINPILVIHGLGDGCNFKNTTKLITSLQRDLDTHVECIEVGNGFFSSIFDNFTNQAIELCDKVKANSNFQNDFSILGISQGSLLGRYIIEICEDMKGRVTRYLSFDGPQMGIGSLPMITCGKICDWINDIVSKIMYKDVLVSHLAPCSYYRYKHGSNSYREHNVFLRTLNNELRENAKIKERFSRLEKVLWIKAKRDKVITPVDSSWFEFYDESGENIVPLKDSDFYLNDYIGLRKWNEEGKVEFAEVEGKHVIYSDEEYYKYFLPFFKQ